MDVTREMTMPVKTKQQNNFHIYLALLQQPGTPITM
jgi:hypothetical protein